MPKLRILILSRLIKPATPLFYKVFYTVCATVNVFDN